MNNNLQDFLKENKAIISYIKDPNGYRIGVMIATKGNETGPKIGVAFFNEVETTPKNIGYKIPLNTLGDVPFIVEKLEKLGLNRRDFKDIKLPFQATSRYIFGPTKFNGNFYNKKALFLLARKRSNFSRETFYIDNSISPEKAFEFINEATLHKQIRKFEYRALRYFKYITPSYKKD